MKAFEAVAFALIAAAGNALFALARRRASGAETGLGFVCAAAVVAAALAGGFGWWFEKTDCGMAVLGNWREILLGGVGLFLTYLGFNLLYSRFGATRYVLYAVLSILTTTVLVGAMLLHEPLNGRQKLAVLLALVTVVLFSWKTASP